MRSFQLFPSPIEATEMCETPGSVGSSSVATPSEGSHTIFTPFEERSPSSRKGSMGGYFKIDTVAPLADECIYRDEKILRNIARKLSVMNSYNNGDYPVPLPTVVRYFLAARPSVKAIAFAYNVLANYSGSTPGYMPTPQAKRQDSLGATLSTPHSELASSGYRPELVLVAALRVATGYVDNRKAPSSWWIREVTRNAFREEDLRQVTEELFTSLGWKFSLFAEPLAINSALNSLSLKISGASRTRPASTRPPLKINPNLSVDLMDATPRQFSLPENVLPRTPKSPKSAKPVEGVSPTTPNFSLRNSWSAFRRRSSLYPIQPKTEANV